jgi:hypothetical protein
MCHKVGGHHKRKHKHPTDNPFMPPPQSIFDEDPRKRGLPPVLDARKRGTPPVGDVRKRGTPPVEDTRKSGQVTNNTFTDQTLRLLQDQQLQAYLSDRNQTDLLLALQRAPAV